MQFLQSIGRHFFHCFAAYSTFCGFRSLQSKLESLKAVKGDYSHVDYGSSRTDSPVPIVKSKGVESSGKYISKDGLSAGSFTQDIRAKWLPGCQILETTSVVEMDTKPEISVFRARRNSQALRFWQRPATNEEGLCGGGRGRERGRIVIGNPKKQAFERVIIWAQPMLLLPPRKENSTSDCGPMVRSSSINDRNRGSCGAGNDDLMGIFNSFADNEIALVFRRRLHSQKRARYKKIIRRHMVLDTLQSRIASCAIRVSEGTLPRSAFARQQCPRLLLQKNTRIQD